MSQKIVLGVCGSISAYKAIDLLRHFCKQGHAVKVVLTPGAEKIVRPEVFRYLGATAVYTDANYFTPPNEETHTPYIIHIDLANWADKLVICPASANTLSQLAQGAAQSLLASVFLALPQTTACVIFPSMNTNMLTHPATVANLMIVGDMPNVFIHPADSGTLACNVVGDGKLPEVSLIGDFCAVINPLNLANKNAKHVVITTGATLSPLDPVRYLTNPSSGLTGYYLAAKFLAQGHKVTVVAGLNATKKLDYFAAHPNYKLVRVISTSNMHATVMPLLPKLNVYISAAAPCDIEFEVQKAKLKKDTLGKTLPIKKAPDILLDVLAKRKKTQQIIGFAAEAGSKKDIFVQKWQKKPVDLLVGNFVNSGATGKATGFACEANQYYFVKNGKLVNTKNLTKIELAEEIYGQTLL